MRGLRAGGLLLAALLWSACGGPEEQVEEPGAGVPPGTVTQAVHTSALEPSWVRTEAQLLFSHVAVDGNGNVYVAFQYNGPATLEGRSLPWNGDASDVHLGVAKFRPGGALVWVRGYAPATPSTDPATSFFVRPAAFSVSSGGTVYLGGEAQGGGVRIGTRTLGNGYFLLSLSFDGQRRFARSTRPAQGTTFSLLDFAVRPGGGFYALASFRVLAESRAPSLMLIRYGSDGEPRWDNVYEQPGDASAEPARVASDELGNAYVSGLSSGAVTFGGPTGSGELTPFAFSTSGSGRHRWTRFMPVAGGAFTDGLVARGGRVVLGITEVSGSSRLMGLTTGSGAERWRQSLGNTGASMAVATSVRNEVVVCVAHGDASALGLPRSTPVPDVRAATSFVARLRRTDGQFGRARNLEVGSGEDITTNGCAASNGGSVAVAGVFRGTADFGDGPRTSATPQTFLLRLTP